MASSVREVWDYRALVANMARRQLKSEHKRDFLGAAWSLLNPLLNLAILSLVFGTILQFGDRIIRQRHRRQRRQRVRPVPVRRAHPVRSVAPDHCRARSPRCGARRACCTRSTSRPTSRSSPTPWSRCARRCSRASSWWRSWPCWASVSWTILVWPLLLPLVAMFAPRPRLHTGAPGGLLRRHRVPGRPPDAAAVLPDADHLLAGQLRATTCRSSASRSRRCSR